MRTLMLAAAVISAVVIAQAAAAPPPNSSTRFEQIRLPGNVAFAKGPTYGHRTYTAGVQYLVHVRGIVNTAPSQTTDTLNDGVYCIGGPKGHFCPSVKATPHYLLELHSF